MRGQPVPDVFGNFLSSAILCIAKPALAGESLLLAGNIVGHAGEGLTLGHRLAGCNFGQGIDGVDAVIVNVGSRCIDVDDNLELCCAQAYVQSIEWRGTACAAGEVVDQFVAHAGADTGKAAAARRVD